MNRLLLGMTAAIVIVNSGCGSIADKIIGVWSITKVNGAAVPADEPATMQFTKDGKHIVTMKIGGQESSAEGAYTVDADKITVTGKGADGTTKSNIITVKSITGDIMVFVKDGVEFELKRK